MLHVVAAGGGGGAAIPGLTGDGLTPAGIVVAGAVNAGDQTLTALVKHNFYGQVEITSGQPDYVDGDWPAYVSQQAITTLDLGDPVPALELQRHVDNTATGVIGKPILRVQDYVFGGPAIDPAQLLGQFKVPSISEGLRINAAGMIGMNGVTPPTAPRTLAQATITAITDANAKAALQACANALSDIGVLTLT